MIDRRPAAPCCQSSHAKIRFWRLGSLFTNPNSMRMVNIHEGSISFKKAIHNLQ
jgi:hypothetical protein